MTKIRGTWPERRNNVVSRIYSNAFIGMKKNYFDVSKIELFILRIIGKKCIELLQYRTRVFQSKQPTRYLETFRHFHIILIDIPREKSSLRFTFGKILFNPLKETRRRANARHRSVIRTVS